MLLKSALVYVTQAAHEGMMHSTMPSRAARRRRTVRAAAARRRSSSPFARKNAHFADHATFRPYVQGVLGGHEARGFRCTPPPCERRPPALMVFYPFIYELSRSRHGTRLSALGSRHSGLGSRAWAPQGRLNKRRLHLDDNHAPPALDTPRASPPSSCARQLGTHRGIT